MAQAKLHINLHSGTIDAEGDEAFVLTVYNDFKESLAQKASKPKSVNEDTEAHDETDGYVANKRTKKVRRASGGRRSSNSEQDGKAQAYKPTLDKSLDTSKLADFMAQFEPKNSAEHILLYAKFLEEELGISPCTMDQIFTCFHAMKAKIPAVLMQAFIDARGTRYGYIDFKTPNDVTIPIRGINHFNSGIKRKGS